MNTKTLKVITTILMVVFMVATISQVVLASNPEDVLNNIKPDDSTINAEPLQKMAGRIIGLIQMASIIAALILIAVFGFKFIMGSANEKAEYQKSFIPLIVGVVVVFSASSIARILLSTFTGLAD